MASFRNAVPALWVILFVACMELADTLMQTHVSMERDLKKLSQHGGGWDSLFSFPEPDVKMLHVGKTGGSSISDAYRNITKPHKFARLSHHKSHDFVQGRINGTILPKKTNYQDIAFWVRAPAHRFVSAWVSRYFRDCDAADPNCARWDFNPDDWGYGHHLSWQPQERWAFETFPTPDDLACSLYSNDTALAKKARTAIQLISHTRQDLKWYLSGLQGIKTIAPHVFFVGRTEHFDDDYSQLSSLLAARHVFSQKPPQSVPKVHTADAPSLRRLGRCATLNLHKWYAEDYQIIEFLASQGLLDHSYLSEVADLDAAPSEGEIKQF